MSHFPNYLRSLVTVVSFGMRWTPQGKSCLKHLEKNCGRLLKENSPRSTLCLLALTVLHTYSWSSLGLEFHQIMAKDSTFVIVMEHWTCAHLCLKASVFVSCLKDWTFVSLPWYQRGCVCWEGVVLTELCFKSTSSLSEVFEHSARSPGTPLQHGWVQMGSFDGVMILSGGVVKKGTRVFRVSRGPASAAENSQRNRPGCCSCCFCHWWNGAATAQRRGGCAASSCCWWVAS